MFLRSRLHRPSSLSVVLTGVATLGIALTATAVAGADQDSDDTGFHVAGDGSLPSGRPELRPVRAPLSAEETGYALHLAATAPVLAGATDVRGEPGPQELYIDLPSIAESEGTHRQAVVMGYDYTAGRAVQVLVDLTAGTVVSTDSDPALRPPIARDEADAAMAIALGTKVEPAFRAQFEAAQGVPLLATDQVGYTAGVWTGDASTTAGRTCAAHRCARLLVSLPNGDYLDTTDVVIDLTDRSALQLK